MSSFEERHAAWIDGKLSGAEEQQFLSELAEHGLTASDREDWLRLREVIVAEASAPELRNADFFQSEILRQIEPVRPASRPERPITGWFWKMALAGAVCLVAAFFLFQQTVPQTPGRVPQAGEYVARVLDAQPGDGVTAVTYQAPKSEMTVLWLEGLEYVPAKSAQNRP